jgi:hypothetical protein
MIPSVPTLPTPPAPPRNDRLVALFLLGVVLFSPLLVRIFGVSATIFGWPVLFVYMFVAWAVVVALIALDVECRGDGRREVPRPPTQGTPAP